MKKIKLKIRTNAKAGWVLLTPPKLPNPMPLYGIMLG